MNKPVYMLPFVFIYNFLVFIFKFIFRFFKYFNVGLFFTIYIFAYIVVNFILLVIKGIIFSFICLSYLLYRFLKYVMIGFLYPSYLVYNILQHIMYGFVVISYFVYRVVRYIGLGFVFPFVLIVNGLKKLIMHNQTRAERRKQEYEESILAKERNRQIEEENRKRLEEARKKELEAEAKRKYEDATKSITDKVEFKKVEKVNHFEGLFASIKAIPSKIKKLFSDIFSINTKKNDINRQALLLDFEGADAEKSAEKIMYKYVAKNPEGKIVKGYFPAYSKVEVHSFLLSEGNEVYSIETNRWIKLMYGSGSQINRTKIKTKDLIFFTTQLSTYLKAGITLVEALKILSRQFKNKTYSRIFRSLIYDLSMGDSFSQAMDKQGEAFPRLFINMVKASEMTGELPEVLDDMEEYFTETDKTRKQMITAMTYPTIIFVLSIVAVVFIMIYVVPKFVNIYNDIDGASIPGITIFVINLSEFLQKNYLILLGVVVALIFVFVYLYRNVKAFKSFIQWLLMHVPVIGNVIIYNEVTMFTKTFASLLAHNVFITDSMDILKRLTNNEVYKSLIFETIDNLAKGEKISLAFENHWAFPLPAYEMIKTGEMTGQLPEMMSKVSNYYQELHKNSVTRIKTFVEPALIIFLTVIVGGIVLSIVVPMFSVYSAIQV